MSKKESNPQPPNIQKKPPPPPAPPSLFSSKRRIPERKTKIDFRGIAHEIKTQDNRITANPLFCVFEKERIYGLTEEYSDTFEWYRSSDNRIEEAGSLSKGAAEVCGYEKLYYIDENKFVNAHFTEKAAREHIRINGHNLNEPFIYVTSLFRCEEMISIREFLKSGDNI